MSTSLDRCKDYSPPGPRATEDAHHQRRSSESAPGAQPLWCLQEPESTEGLNSLFILMRAHRLEISDVPEYARTERVPLPKRLSVQPLARGSLCLALPERTRNSESRRTLPRDPRRMPERPHRAQAQLLLK